MQGQTLYQVYDQSTSPAGLSAALFAGELVVFQSHPAVLDIAATARTIVEDIFGPGEAQTAEQRIDPQDLRKRVTLARKAISTDGTLSGLFRAFLSSIGYNQSDVFADRLLLRAVPSAGEAHSRFARPLPIHRDTWGSRIHAQINWWLPLYPLTETRTMLVWPQMFATAVRNTSETWDLNALVRDRVKDYPLLPEASEDLASGPIPILLEPGTMLAFSAAHLHSSISDASGVTRFSLDTRTVWSDDLLRGRGAPNVDCARKPPHWQMFQPAADEALGEVAMAIENPAIGGAQPTHS